jgi:hypothetical protein
MIPESQKPVTSSLQKLRSPSIAVQLFCMLAAIGFDHQLRFKARKIIYVGLNHHLASKLESS